MVQITKHDDLNAYRFKRDKMLEAKENGMDADDILFVFKMSIQEVINQIADLDAQILAEDKPNNRFPVCDEQQEKHAICAATSF